MARTFTAQSKTILQKIQEKPGILLRSLFDGQKEKTIYKDFYNNVYRLVAQGFLSRQETEKGASFSLTADGAKMLDRFLPKKDGIWKLVIFDIPEKQKKVRVILRAKLKQLNFKKWQNSIWISPYVLDKEIENELKELGKKFFIRLIKTTDINRTEDLEQLFE